jgi:hypothetical protein
MLGSMIITRDYSYFQEIRIQNFLKMLDPDPQRLEQCSRPKVLNICTI